MPPKDKNAKANSESNVPADLPKEVVIIPIVNSPIFPGMIAPIILSEDKYTPELDAYLAKNNYVALNLVKFKDFGEAQEVLQEMDEEQINYEDDAGDEAKYGGGLTSADDITPKGITPKDIYKVGVLCKVNKKL